MLSHHRQRNQRQYGRPERSWLTFFWNAKDILLIDYFPTDQTIMGQYYANIRDQIQEKIRKQRSDLARKKVIFRQEKACPHTSVITMAKTMN